MTNKIIGYILLAIGLIIISWTLLASYDIFTGKSSAPKLFLEYTKEAPANGGASSDVQKQLEQAITKQLGDMLPVDSIPKILNLLVWSMLAGILVLGGAQISGIGIKLIAVKSETVYDK